MQCKRRKRHPHRATRARCDPARIPRIPRLSRMSFGSTARPRGTSSKATWTYLRRVRALRLATNGATLGSSSRPLEDSDAQAPVLPDVHVGNHLHDLGASGRPRGTRDWSANSEKAYTEHTTRLGLKCGFVGCTGTCAVHGELWPGIPRAVFSAGQSRHLEMADDSFARLNVKATL